ASEAAGGRQSHRFPGARRIILGGRFDKIRFPRTTWYKPPTAGRRFASIRACGWAGACLPHYTMHGRNSQISREILQIHTNCHHTPKGNHRTEGGKYGIIKTMNSKHEISHIKIRRQYSMSGLMEGLLKRRSVRAYKPDMVPQEAIDKILEAGTYA